MALFKTITQGGQVHIHQLRMLKQIFCAGCIASLVIGGGYFGWKCFNIPTHARQMAYETYWAKFMMATNPDVNHKKLTQMYTPAKGEPFRRHSLSILKDPHLQNTTAKVERYVVLMGIKSLWMALWAFLGVMGFWFVYGLSQKRKQHQRGTTLVPWKDLKRLIRRNRETSWLKLRLKPWGKLPLLKNKETSHMLFTGTTGTGKTNAFHSLLPQIRKKGQSAIIVDITGDYVSRYYDETRDIILNPLDKRSQPWHPWVDCHLDSHYDVLAESLIQTKGNAKDPFWDNASRAILKAALRKAAAQGDYDIENLTHFLLTASDREFEDYFQGTDAATFAFKNNEKTTASIRSVLSSQIEGLRQLETPKASSNEVETSKDEPAKIETAIEIDAPELSQGEVPQVEVPPYQTPEEEPSQEEPSQEESSEPEPPIPPFSIREWVAQESKGDSHGGWLFITARPDQRQTLTPLISAWVDLAINALMVLPGDQKRRLWFVIDELAALQKLPGLSMGLAEGRKYGGCFLVGFQSKPQLEDIYGRNGAEAMLDLFNTKIFFRCTEPSTQAWISKVLGDREETEPSENISFGAHAMRDGVSLSRQTHTNALVMPTELSQLKDLSCYLKLPGDYPCAKLQTKYQKAPRLKKSAFLLKPEKKKSIAVKSLAPDPSPPPAQQEVTQAAEEDEVE